jgi:hypothetical protein
LAEKAIEETGEGKGTKTMNVLKRKKAICNNLQPKRAELQQVAVEKKWRH